MLRRLYSPLITTGWDSDMKLEEKTRWAQWFSTMSDQLEITFPRSTQPPDALGNPRLAGFCDAVGKALCATVYIIWQASLRQPTSRLLMGKCRVAPLLGYTIPRGELQSLVVLHHLILIVAEAFPVRFDSILTFTDSTSSIGAIRKSASVLKPFFANRASDILQLRQQLGELTDNLVPVQHMAGNLNPANLVTRGQAGLKDLGEGYKWQHGPSFLLLPFEDWI